MLTLFVVALAGCLSCRDAQGPQELRLGIPEPTIDFQEAEGCVKFELTLVAGSAPTSQSVYTPNWPCPSGELRVLTDTAVVFDSATGALRVGVVLENVGTLPIIGPVRLSDFPSAIERYNAQGAWVPAAGLPPILGYQADSTGAGGRSWWTFTHLLAAPGQPQVLMPGARTLRRWVEFRGTSWAYRTRLKVWALGKEAGSVPAMPPDSTPAFANDSQYVVLNTEGGMGFVRDLLQIQFRASATQAQKEQVIASISGVVVGGKRGSIEGGGVYFVRIPTDTSFARLEAAEATASAHPAVLNAIRYTIFFFRPTYLMPSDGTAWAKTDWRADTSGLGGPTALPNWGLRYSRFPLAWGCSIGDSSTNVGVVDIGLRLAGAGWGDVAQNVVTARGADLVGDTAVAHASWVASVLGARGDNGSGITGGAWRVRLEVRDPTPTDAQGRPQYILGQRSFPYASVENAMDSLIAGNRIINVSLGASNVRIFSVQDTARLRLARGVVGAYARSVARLQTDPLFVVSTGNVPQGDPRESLFPLLLDNMVARTLVVGAITRAGTLLSAATGSNYISVVAPGESIGVLGGPPQTGASFATPFVSALASLLLSFDPRLTAAELKQLIVDGAVRSGRTVGGYPVIDAYESLRLAAERPGAPLCGNRVWAAGGSVSVQRTETNNTFTDEVIGAAPAGDRAWINVFHGGRRVQNETALGWQAYTWSNGIWSAANAILSAPPTTGGTWSSSRARDHDGTKTVETVSTFSGTNISFDIRVGTATLHTIGPFTSGVDSSNALCIKQGSNCDQYAYRQRIVRAKTALSADGNRAFVAITRELEAPHLNSWITCAGGGAQCAIYTYTLSVEQSAQFYEVDLTSGTGVLRWSLPNLGVTNLALSERDDELVVSEGLNTLDTEYTPHPTIASLWNPTNTSLTQSCNVVFRSVSKPAVTGAILRSIPIEAASGCAFGLQPGGGTVAPRIAPIRVSP